MLTCTPSNLRTHVLTCSFQVGLDVLKEEIRALRRSLVVDRQRRKVTGAARSKGFQGAPHMIFMGSPGTGKTESARLIAKLLKELRYVDGPLIEVQRADLVAGFVGQTALKTREVKSPSTFKIVLLKSRTQTESITTHRRW